MLLRSDTHILFGKGYITDLDDHRLEIRRLDFLVRPDILVRDERVKFRRATVD